MSAHLRNKAEGTRTVTTFGDFYVGVMTRGREHPRRGLIVEISRALIAQRNHRQRPRISLRIADAEDVVDLTGADERIDFWHLSPQLVAIALNQTACDHQPFRLAISFQTRRFENRFDRFLLC